MYAINCLSKWWQKWEKQGWMRKPKKGLGVKNLDLIKRGVELQKFHRVTFQWVKGHAGVRWNEYVDGLVNSAVQYALTDGEIDTGYIVTDEIQTQLATRREEDYRAVKLQGLLWEK